MSCNNCNERNTDASFWQFDADKALAFTGCAAPLRDVEGEPAGIVALGFSGRRRCKRAAHMIKQTRVGGQIGTRCAPNRLLVNIDQPLDVLHPGLDVPGSHSGPGGLEIHTFV